MKWKNQRESEHVEDRRSSGMPGGLGGLGGQGGMGGLGGLLAALLGGKRLGVGAIVIALVAWLGFGINPMTVLQVLNGEGTSFSIPGAEQSQTSPLSSAPKARSAQDDELARFVSVVLADTEDVWKQVFSDQQAVYKEPNLVLFRGSTSTACGRGQAAMGPFYCPADQKVYIDLGFYETLRNRLGAPGDFAQAYVVAHEVGHHVQNLLGINARVERERARLSQVAYNQLSVKLELQADCFAGLWAHHAQKSRQILEAGDIEQAMNAAARIGDDALQQASGGEVVPESFTHGTGDQRQRWFMKGLQGGTLQACDTFNARNL